jgi:hypothetical protein
MFSKSAQRALCACRAPHDGEIARYPYTGESCLKAVFAYGSGRPLHSGKVR